MLELRPNCEHCNKDLPPDAVDALICTFECTYCEKCVTTILKNTCPNCGGNFTKRPLRPKRLLEKYPPSLKRVHNPTDLERHYENISKNST
ncbi:DUF1272 domain-containing protein [Kordia jejudonensis]|uniref:DUF1272 domain-containing protein n=1 Tax=Kordia jejudonensis TaxID=1348245 RepID=UPI0006290959|nr:DUF1272 domain-containing protein [Kordia jejudonensis]